MKFYSSNSAFTDAMKTHVINNEKQHLRKYINGAEGSCKFKVEPNGTFKFELEYPALGIRASFIAADFYDAVDEVIDRVLVQLKKEKEKNSKKSVSTLPEEELLNGPFSLEELLNGPFSREKLFYIVEMTDERAINEMEKLGHSFFVYKDIYAGESDLVSIAYKRSDGSYGVIRCR